MGLPEFETLSEVNFDDLPAIDWIVEGVLPSRGTLFLVAESGAGKSTLAAQLFAHVAAGRDFFGFRVPKPRKVLLWPGEGIREHVLSRLRTMFDECDLDAARANMLFPRVLLPETFASDQFRRVIETLKPEVVVIDTFNLFFKDNENDNSAVANSAARPLKQIAEQAGCAFVILGHYGKMSAFMGDPERRDIRGASALRGFADAMVHLDLVSGKPDERKFHCTKQRNGAPFSPLRLRVDFDRAVFERLSSEEEERAQKNKAKVEALKPRILEALATTPRQSGRKIREAVRGTPQDTKAALDLLVADGLVLSEPGPRNSDEWFLVTVKQGASGSAGG